MKITEHINRSNKTLFSFEIIPPLRGQSLLDIFNVLDPLIEFKPSFIDVTYHRKEFIYKNYGHKLASRPGTLAICAAIMNKYGVDAVPHLLCGDLTKQMTEDALIDLTYLEVDNILALRGDPIKHEKVFTPEIEGHSYAVELVKQIVDLNAGIYLNVKSGQTSDFCIGVAGYPEKHFEAPNKEEDIFRLKDKIDAGANYIITQMFFDNYKYFNFVDRCRSIGINVPIIPGIKPIYSKSQLNSIPANFYVDIPNELVKEIQKLKNHEYIYQVGIEWALQQSKELKNAGVPIIHYYTMSRTDNVYNIVKSIF